MAGGNYEPFVSIVEGQIPSDHERLAWAANDPEVRLAFDKTFPVSERPNVDECRRLFDRIEELQVLFEDERSLLLKFMREKQFAQRSREQG